MKAKHKGFVLCQLALGLPMGGAQNLEVQIANAHAEEGHESHLISLQGPGPLSSRIQPNVHVHYLYYKRESIRNPFKFVISVIQGYRLITNIIRVNKIDVMQTHLTDANLWGLVIAFMGKCTVVATIHNNNFLGEERTNPIAKYFKRKIYKMIFHYCSAVVACSAGVKRSILDGLGIPESKAENVFTVTNGVLAPDKIAEDDIIALRSRWGAGSGDTLLLAAGRLTEAKNFACLIDAIAELKKEKIYPQLVIAGDGPLMGKLKNRITDCGLSDQVSLPGNLDNLTMLMSASDCLVMPSRWEGLPLVLLEGMIRGLPVVGTRIKGIEDIIKEGQNGYLVDVDDVYGLAEGIKKIKFDPEKTAMMGRENQLLAQDKYSFQSVYKNLVNIFDQSLKKG